MLEGFEPYGLSGESSENGEAAEYAGDTVVTPPEDSVWSALLSDFEFSGPLIDLAPHVETTGQHDWLGPLAARHHARCQRSIVLVHSPWVWYLAPRVAPDDESHLGGRS